MREALRRLSAYFIDLIIIYFLSALISSIIIACTNYDKFLNTYNKYTNNNNTYINFFTDFENSFSDNNLSKEEYDQLVKEYSDIAIDLAEAYADNALTKKEYKNIYDSVYSVYDRLYIENSYELAKVNTVNTVVLSVLTIIYFVFVQYFNKGQTIGKKLFRYRIVTKDNERVTINHLFLRSLIITNVVWSSISLYCLYTMDAYGYYNASLYLSQIMYIIFIISFLFIIYRKDKRSLHDLFAGTKVVEIKDRG